MKKCKCAWLYTNTGYPFAVYGKRGSTGVVVEWEWGCEAVRVPMWFAVRCPDATLSLAVMKEVWPR